MSELVIDERVFDPCIDELRAIIDMSKGKKLVFLDVDVKRLENVYRDLQHNAVDLRMAQKRGIESLRSEQ